MLNCGAAIFLGTERFQFFYSSRSFRRILQPVPAHVPFPFGCEKFAGTAGDRIAVIDKALHWEREEVTCARSSTQHLSLLFNMIPVN